MSIITQLPVHFIEHDPDRISSQTVCITADCTYRQLDFWARTYLIPGLDRDLCPGSGAQRSWTPQRATSSSAFLTHLHLSRW